ncbi:hypothetical protein [Eggerthella sp. YY7918]|uniref:hypothetical protein n=1 Tax=Eggerthella sp. (strain YY7918) TaxID=502558 RepID=UPI00021711B8|nr:hypothetical protein [Eggerthella sp. YY7918]BAK44139.1 hypothetical protein EGYY_09520 [Eggerthella sp. YY7918]
MGAAPAYSYYPERIPQQAPRTRVRVVPGRGPLTQAPTLPESVVLLAKVVAVVLVIVSLAAFARIALSSAAVSTSVQSQELSQQIDEARASGASLEVSQSLLTNPTRLKREAAAIGMAAPETIGTINLAADVVVCDAEGNLSLSKSVAAAAGIGE